MNIRQKIALYRLAIKNRQATFKNLQYVYSKKLQIKPEFPRQLGFYFSNQCNLKCRMCRQWGELGTYGSQDIKATLPIEIVYPILEEAQPFHPELLVSGGEPTIYPDLDQFITYAKYNHFVLTIFTNGSMLDRYAALFLKTKVDVLCVGLQGLEKTHDAIVQVKGTFKKIMNGLKRYEGHRNKPLIKAYITVTDRNLDDIQDLLALIERNPAIDMTVIQLRWFVHNHIGKRYGQRVRHDLSDLNVATESWRGLVDERSGEIGRRVAQLITRIKSNAEFRKPIQTFPVLETRQIPYYYQDASNNFGRSRCWEPYTSLNVRNNGDVVVCRLHPDIILGNVFVESIKDIWQGEKLKKFRESHAKNGLFSICSRCYGLYK